MCALGNLGNIKKGDLRYFIEHEDNLIHKGGGLVGWIYSINVFYEDECIFYDVAVIMKSVFTRIFLFITMR